MNPQQPLGPNPEWEHEDAYREAWRAAGHRDELYDSSLVYKIEDRIDSALWDEETKHEFSISLPQFMTNGEMSDVLDYLWQYQPRTPYSQVKNPTQKQINAFIRKVCNL